MATSSTRAVALIAIAAGAGWLTDALASAEEPGELYTAPALGDQSSPQARLALALCSALSREIGTVEAQDSDGPPGRGPFPPLTDVTVPARWYQAQKYALGRAFGMAACPSTTPDGRRGYVVPRLTKAAAKAWMMQWEDAGDRWAEARAAASIPAELAPDIQIRTAQIQSQVGELRRLRLWHASWAAADPLSPTDATAIQAAIRQIAVVATPAATSELPWQVTSGAQVVMGAISDIVTAPARLLWAASQRTQSAVLGAAAGALGSVLRAFAVPAGIALVVGVGGLYLVARSGAGAEALRGLEDVKGELRGQVKGAVRARIAGGV